MLDISLEIVRTVILFFLLLWLWKQGKAHISQSNRGWNFLLSGFALLLFGSVLDITDNFDSLNWLIIVGDTEVEAILEKLVGFLGGFLLLAIGLVLWIPTVQRLSEEIEQHKKTTAKLQKRTQELQVQQSELEALLSTVEQANNAKSQFLSSMSHELRTPMNSVLGFSELLATDTNHPLTEEQLESLKQIKESGHQLLHLINDMLDLAKIESGHIEVHITSVNVNELLTQTCELMEPQAENQSIILENTLSDNDLELAINTDQAKIQQVLLNFVSNAIKYNQEKGTVTLSCNKTADSRIRISVTDTGQGIPEQHLPALFEPFNRLGQESSAIQGTGIGLTICQQLVERLGGEIGAYQNENGEGMTFWIEFNAA